MGGELSSTMTGTLACSCGSETGGSSTGKREPRSDALAAASGAPAELKRKAAEMLRTHAIRRKSSSPRSCSGGQFAAHEAR